MVRGQPKTDDPGTGNNPIRKEVGSPDRSAPLLSIIARRENQSSSAASELNHEQHVWKR